MTQLLTGERDTETSLLESVLRAEQAQRQLDDPELLQHLALRLIELAKSNGYEYLVGASSDAEKLVTTSLILSEGQLSRCVGDSQQYGKVLVVDTTCISGNLVRAQIESVKQFADEVGVVLYQRVRPDLDDLDQLMPDGSIHTLSNNKWLTNT